MQGFSRWRSDRQRHAGLYAGDSDRKRGAGVSRWRSNRQRDAGAHGAVEEVVYLVGTRSEANTLAIIPVPNVSFLYHTEIAPSASDIASEIASLAI